MAAEARFSQARIRVNRYGAAELREALDAHLGFLLDAREAVRDIDDARRKLDARTEHTRRVIAELDRTADEQGWSHGQLQQRDT